MLKERETLINVLVSIPQPACAITGEGLDDALEHLYDMIHKQRRLAKTNKKRPR